MSGSTDESDNLNSEICKFADTLPYWSKYLCSIVLAGEIIGEVELDKAYTYLLEDAGLAQQTDKHAIAICLNEASSGDYKKALFLSALQNVQGVNALVENQLIEFHPKLTILYGVNGSGKSGYTRLLKKAFHSRIPEDILKNIYIPAGHKDVKAEIKFTSGDNTYPLTYPDHVGQSEFRQFSIFDNKSVNIHLTKKNEFEFRPAGLDFFADLIEAFKQIEDKLEVAIAAKTVPKNYPAMFDGDSKIKTQISGLSANTNLDELKKLIPITEDETRCSSFQFLTCQCSLQVSTAR